MSRWQSGFRRIKTRVQKGLDKNFDSTVDPTFDTKHKAFFDMGKHLQKTYKDMQSCLDSMRALTGATNTVADDLLRVYDQQARTYNAVTTFKSVQEELDTNIRASVDAIFVERVLGPVGELLALFPEVKKRCEARGKLLLDYDYYRNKVHKLKEKPSSDPTVLPRKEKKLSASKDAYTSLNQELINEFTAFESRRNELLNQPFLALMGCTWMYMTGCVSHMKGLGPFLQYSDFIDHGELNALTGQGGSRPGDDLFRSPNFSELHDMLNPQQAGGGDEDGVPSHTRTGSTSSGMAAASHEETTMGETASSFHQMSLNVGGDNGARAEALFKFEAREDNELSFDVGDTIIVTKQDDSGWWEGTNRGCSGLFPYNYVRIL